MSLTQQHISLSAPAKINLFLHVIKKRQDGYHDLKTWMQKIDLYDRVDLRLNDMGVVEFCCDFPLLPTDNSNLAVKAAEVFLECSSRLSGCGVDIELEKKIPVAAGLGGGSSDAGAVLLGLNRLAELEFSVRELLALARPLGADVPFFAVEHPAVIAEGIGDVMYPVDPLLDCSFILINPNFFVSTAWAFENLSLTRQNKNSKVPRFRKHQPISLTLADMHNDLEQVTCKRYQELEVMKESLLAAGASGVLMSGSGPTVFGVFPDSGNQHGSHLQSIVGQLRREYGNKVFLSRACTGAWPSGKAPGFDPGIRRFESCRPSHH
jgi:4-diphosphocytidyl-2-C-methyl-D-erythritol kinase